MTCTNLRKLRMWGSLIGGVVGDAYGANYEFKARDTYSASDNMEYNTVFNIPAGSFTDDSSMMLCLADSLAEKRTFDPYDQMKKYARWRDNLDYSSVPERGCFDIGRTTKLAIANFMFDEQNKENKEKQVKYYGLDGTYDSGNGGIMRLAPIPIFYWKDIYMSMNYSSLSSKVTHMSEECLDCAALMGLFISLFIKGYTKAGILVFIKKYIRNLSQKVQEIADATFLNKTRNSIESSGYVVHSLEAALWSFYKTNTFEDGMKICANLGRDTDTICCIYGQIAGSCYSIENIPEKWISALQRKEYIFSIFKKFIAVVSICDDTIN